MTLSQPHQGVTPGSWLLINFFLENRRMEGIWALFLRVYVQNLKIVHIAKTLD